jgi:toluene monooxygenase system protein E
MTTPVAPRAHLKTYSHLAPAARIPTPYEVATTQLLYHPTHGFELPNLPFAKTFAERVQASALSCDDWERFADPRATTYSAYTALMSRREGFVDGLLERMASPEYMAQLGASALRLHDELVTPLRYPLHGLQMVTAYVGHLAPSGRIAITCAFQAADEVRRIQRLAYRMAQLRARQPVLGDSARARWEKHAEWQPLRRLIEELLVTWDFGEAFTALSLVVKPAFDALVNERLAAVLRTSGDYLFAEVLGSFAEDAHWHRDWSAALVDVAVAQRPENRRVIDEWVKKWEPKVADALRPLEGILT